METRASLVERVRVRVSGHVQVRVVAFKAARGEKVDGRGSVGAKDLSMLLSVVVWMG